MKLNIYENKKVVKTYKTEAYEIMWGTLEDIAETVNIDALESMDRSAIMALVLKLVMKNMSEFKRLLKDIFEGLTDEELRNARVTEISRVMVDVVLYTASQLGKEGTEKN